MTFLTLTMQQVINTVGAVSLRASLKAAGKSRGETLFVVASALANAGINWAFKTWGELADERRADV